MIRSYKAEIQRLAELHPEAWKNAHTGNAHTEDFVRIIASHLHTIDSRVGLNGKRGNPNDISDDALNFLDPIDGPGRTPDGKRCWVVDFIVGAGGPNPRVDWNAFDDPVASTGAWVTPTMTAPPKPVPPPPPAPKTLTKDEAYVALQALNAFYMAEDGLQRPGGLVLPDRDGRMVADMEAIKEWFFQLVIERKSMEDVKAQIRTTHEWKVKHGVPV